MLFRSERNVRLVLGKCEAANEGRRGKKSTPVEPQKHPSDVCGKRGHVHGVKRMNALQVLLALIDENGEKRDVPWNQNVDVHLAVAAAVDDEPFLWPDVKADIVAEKANLVHGFVSLIRPDTKENGP